MKALIIAVTLILSLMATEASAYSWFFGSSYYPYNDGYYSYGYYGYGSYYRPYYSRWGYANPYLINRELYTIERNPMPQFALANTNSLYRFASSNRNYYPLN